IEAYYPAHDKYDTRKYTDIANRYGLFITGGSDWHGKMSEWNIGIGECGINQAMLDRLIEGNLTYEKGRGGM
ncbi:MAG: hypothetical protein GX825_10120, partial [Syntrophomonadaceae bacterium]|nr:hypothetical protein [Syntrophomonadaceae bacterium]